MEKGKQKLRPDMETWGQLNVATANKVLTVARSQEQEKLESGEYHWVESRKGLKLVKK